MPLDDQQALGIVLVIDASESMEEDALIERVKEAAHEFVDAKAATDQIADRRASTTTVDGRPGLHHRQGRCSTRPSTTSPSSRAPRCRTASCGRRRSYRRLRAPAEPRRVLRRRGQRLQGRRRPRPRRPSTSRRRHALRRRRRERRLRRARRRSPPRPAASAAVADDPNGVGALFDERAGDAAQAVRRHLRLRGHRAGTGRRSTLTVGDRARPTAEFVAGSPPGRRRSRCSPQPVDEPSGPGLPPQRPPGSDARPRPRRRWPRVVRRVHHRQLVLRRRGHARPGARSPTPRATSPARVDDDDGGDGKGQALAQTPLLQRAVEATEQLRRAARASSSRSRACSSRPTCRCARPRRCSSTSPAWSWSRCCSFAVARQPARRR